MDKFLTGHLKETEFSTDKIVLPVNLTPGCSGGLYDTLKVVSLSAVASKFVDKIPACPSRNSFALLSPWSAGMVSYSFTCRYSKKYNINQAGNISNFQQKCHSVTKTTSSSM